MLWFLNIVCCAAAGAKAAETRCAVAGAVAVEEESCCVTQLAPLLHTYSLVLKNSDQIWNLDCKGRCKTYGKKEERENNLQNRPNVTIKLSHSKQLNATAALLVPLTLFQFPNALAD